MICQVIALINCLILLVPGAAALAQEPELLSQQARIQGLPVAGPAALAVNTALGCDGVTLDLALSRDGELLVVPALDLLPLSDAGSRYPDRVQDGLLPVFALDLAELRGLSWQGEAPALATLAEVLDLRRVLRRELGRELLLSLELRQPWRHRRAGLDLVAALLQALKRSGLEGRLESVRIQSYDHQELRRLAGELLPAHNLALDLIQLIGDSHGREVQIEQWGAWLPYDFDWMLSHSGLRVLADRVQGIGLAQELLVAPDGTSLLDSQLATLRQLGLSL